MGNGLKFDLELFVFTAFAVATPCCLGLCQHPQASPQLVCFLFKQFWFPAHMNVLRGMCNNLPKPAAEGIYYSDPDLGIGSHILFSFLSAGVSIQASACRVLGNFVSLEEPPPFTSTTTTTTTTPPPPGFWDGMLWLVSMVASTGTYSLGLGGRILWSSIDSLATLLWGPAWASVKFYTTIALLSLTIGVGLWGLNIVLGLPMKFAWWLYRSWVYWRLTQTMLI